MKSLVYKNDIDRAQLLIRYDKKQKSLKIPTEDIYVNTFAGKTHVLASGPLDKPPVVLLHAFNAGAPASLEPIQGLQKDFRLYAIDSIGQATKSEETKLSLKNDDYGKWLNEVLTELKIAKASIIGVSYGGFLALKLMRYAPQKVNKSILIVPAGIVDGNIGRLLRKVTLPMLGFLITESEKSLQRFMDAFFTSINKEDISFIRSILLGTRQDHRKPPLVNKKELEHFEAPTYIMVADNDIFFPANKVLKKSKAIFKNLKESHVLRNSKHVPSENAYSEIELKISNWLNQ